MNFKKKISGSWTDTPHYIHNTSTDTITTLPAVIHPTGTTATVGLKGNTLQSSIPSPTSPVMPRGTGERTGNLFDFPVYRKDINSPNAKIYSIYLPENTYVLSCEVLTHEGVALGSAGAMYITFNGTKRYIIPNSNSIDNFVKYSITFTGEITEVGFVGYNYDSRNPNSYVIIKNIQLNTGSTALPYEPYGYKIPISSANTTTNIYLGEVETTRRIRKLVLTGEENFILKDRPDTANYMYVLRLYHNNTIGVCSHLPYTDSYPRTFLGFRTDASMQLMYMCIGPELQEAQPGGNTVEGFRYYLAAQYANGTPVTIWYVLAEPETAVVNEPLMKIGDYADIVSDISVPVTAGGDTISVDTTVQPSETTVTWAGWHNADVKEYHTDKTISDLEDMTILQMQTCTIASLQGGNWI